jgi:hypothetical protein
MRSHLIIVISAAITVAACSAKDSSSAAAETTAKPETPVTSAPSSKGDVSAEQLSNYTLDMDKMTKWLNVMKNIATQAKNDSSAAAAFESDGNETVAQSVAKLKASPFAQRALSAAGMSAEDYVMTSMAYLQAGMAAGLLKSVPNYKVPAGQNMKNIDFINKHGAEIEAKMKAMGADMSQ